MRRLLLSFFLVVLLIIPVISVAQTFQLLQIWDDVNNLDGSRPENVQIRVNGSTYPSGSIVQLDNGSYEFMQSNLPDGYIADAPFEVHRDELTQIVFINRHQPLLVNTVIQNELVTSNLVISKNADFSDESDIFYIEVILPKTYTYITSSGTTGTTDSPIPLHNGESVTISDIPVGTPYTITELPDPRYLSSSSNSAGIIQATGNEAIFTNNLITTTFKVNKQWQGTAHDKITLHLFADGEEIDANFEKEGDVYTASNLPKYAADGHEILYSATEDYWQEYITMYMNVGNYSNRTKAIYNGGTIINKQVTSFSIRKEWVGVSPENQPEITFQLYQNGKPIVWRQPDYKNGVYIWENLPAMKDGELANYYVLENPVDGYETSYKNPGHIEDQKALNGGIITNYKIPKTGDRENPLILAVVIVLSIAGIAVVMLRKRR